MPGVEDWINNPLNVLESLCEQNGALNSLLVSNYFSKLLTSEAISFVPSLNSTPLYSIPANSLVQYRCMVQDMFDPEFYLGVYEIEDTETGHTVLKSGKYKDVVECCPRQTIKTDSPRNIMLDRQTLYCVPLPGETDWVKHISFSFKVHCLPLCFAKITGSSSNSPQCSLMDPCSPSQKRNHRDVTPESHPRANQKFDSVHPTSNAASECDDLDVNMEAESKRTRLESEKASGLSSLPDLNFPLPDEKGTACLVKIYENADGFKVNDMVDFFGVLSVDPVPVQVKQNMCGSDSCPGCELDGVADMLTESISPPPSLVPRLHAVLARKLCHNNPLLPPYVNDKVMSELGESIENLRRRLLEILQYALFGDSLAAEYLLCYLISSVYATAGVMPLGKMCLNLSGCPQSAEYGELLHKLISNLVTKTYLLPLTLRNINELAFYPRKDYLANKLKSGLLQLSQETHLIINETVLQPGQVTEEGQKNIKAIESLILWQKLSYDFNFYQQEFSGNIAVLTLSEGKSILPSDFLLPLDIQSVPTDLQNYFFQLNQELTDTILRNFRIYLGMVKLADYKIEENIQELIQEDFVEMRKENIKNMTEDDFHALLNLTRLLTLSMGIKSPTQQIWHRAKTIEGLRKQRSLDSRHYSN